MEWSSIATIVTSILSGAGGAALLDLWWKPKRDRRRVSSLLLAEIIINTDYLLLQAHARDINPKNIPRDFELSTKGWEKVGEGITELDPDLVKHLLLLYIRYSDLNNYVEMYKQLIIEKETMRPTDSDKIEHHLITIIDTFNNTIDKAIDSGKSLLTNLTSLAGIKEKRANNTARDYASDIENFMTDRENRIKWLQSLKTK